MINVIQRRLLNSSARNSSTSRNIFRPSTQTNKDEPYNKLHSGLCMNPHPAKRDKGGEDAATVTESFIALADGVGGWADSGVDPADYSRQLCKNIQHLIKYDDANKYMRNPRSLCVDAVELTKTVTGSSTCVIASMDKEAPVLYTSNLGDSGYLLIRKQGKDLVTVFRSVEQTHGFNFPFQIGTDGDNPLTADSNLHEVDHNDILIMGTDGLFDNLFDEKIIDLVAPFVRGKEALEDPNLIANVIAKEAEKRSRDTYYLSPFAKSAKEQSYDFMGGKEDDITIAVAQVKLANKGNE
mmetsp:Transcript_5726/g.6274  ORF Transcript_5726/g.6274 Transcript_5726/m.6274 type:complete len:296 (+) Transcript_5726:117-1004(+)